MLSFIVSCQLSSNVRAVPRSFEDSDTHLVCLQRAGHGSQPDPVVCGQVGSNSKQVNEMISASVFLSSCFGRKCGRWHTSLGPARTDGYQRHQSLERHQSIHISSEISLQNKSLPFFCTEYLNFFNLSQNRTSTKSVLGSMQPAGWLKASQTCCFSLLGSSCLQSGSFRTCQLFLCKVN